VKSAAIAIFRKCRLTRSLVSYALLAKPVFAQPETQAAAAAPGRSRPFSPKERQSPVNVLLDINGRRDYRSRPHSLFRANVL
jgi:hypothetical protein